MTSLGRGGKTTDRLAVFSPSQKSRATIVQLDYRLRVQMTGEYHLRRLDKSRSHVGGRQIEPSRCLSETSPQFARGHLRS